MELSHLDVRCIARPALKAHSASGEYCVSSSGSPNRIPWSVRFQCTEIHARANNALAKT